MLHKQLFRLPTYLLLSLLLVLSLTSLTAAQTDTPAEVPAATEEATATDEAAPVVVVNVDTDTPAAPSTDADWFNLRLIVELVGGLVLIGITIFKGGDILAGMGKLVSLVTGNQVITDAAIVQYNSLSPEIRSRVATFIDVVSPLTSTTINEVDDHIIAWFRKIVTPTVASAQVKDDNQGVG